MPDSCLAKKDGSVVGKPKISISFFDSNVFDSCQKQVLNFILENTAHISKDQSTAHQNA